MTNWSATLGHHELPTVIVAALVLAALLWRFLPTSRPTLMRMLLVLGALALLDIGDALLAPWLNAAISRGLHEAAVLGLGVVLIRLAGLVAFRVLLPALRVQTPRIVEDIVVIAGYLLWAMVRLSIGGVELTSLVATSAVITAVIAFAMQDTLGNILGGLALQLDDSLQIGDWLRLDDVSGQVVEIQWRFTALLTRNGERVTIPNAQLMKGKFSVVAERDAGAGRWRRWVWFNIDYNVSPSLVIAAAEHSVADAMVPNVASSPPPSCVVMDFAAGSVRYALRYWLIDPRNDDATDSEVRTHLLACVQRHGWRMALPDQAVHLIEDSEARRQAAWLRELARRVAALQRIELFASLDEGERHKLAERLVHAPFVHGDLITRQGDTAHWLYIMASGQADVFWETPTGERRLLRHLEPGSIFGEMGLMTGAPRSASVVAASDVECYRLDKASFEDIIHQRQAIAERISHILAQRMQESDELRDAFRKEHSESERAAHRAAILQRMREFFGLG